MAPPFSQLHFWTSKNKNERESYNLSKILNFEQTNIHGRKKNKINAKLATKETLGKEIKNRIVYGFLLSDARWSMYYN